MSIVFLLIASVIAQTKTPYCKTFSGETCTECIEGYMRVSNECKFKRDLHCEEYSIIDGETICMKCSPGYKLNKTSKTCVEGKEFCTGITYTKENGYGCHSSSCGGGYSSTNSEKICLYCAEINPYCDELIPGKDDCKKCKKCKDGTRNNTEGICEIVQTNIFCESFNASGVCEKCVKGYSLNNNNICVFSGDEGCLKYYTNPTSGETKCEYCYNGGHVEGKKCVPGCDAQHCAFCVATNKTKCYKCEYGYREINGSCYKYPQNCGSLYKQNATCSRCADGFGFNDKSECVACPTGCKSCKNSTVCDLCLPSMAYQDGKCFPAVENCKTYDKNTGKCTQCQDGITLTNEKCTRTEFCQTKDGQRCIKCFDGYFLKSDYTCAACDKTKCFAGKCIHNATTCIDYKNIAECREYGKDYKCIRCGEGYRLVGEKCEFISETVVECMNKLKNGTCIMCGTYNYTSEVGTYFYPNEKGECKTNDTKPPSNTNTTNNNKPKDESFGVAIISLFIALMILF